MWDDQSQAFAADYRVVRYDMRAAGLSELPTAPFSHAADLHSLLKHVGVGRAHLVGLSLGAVIALDVALEHPERVQSLTLVGPSFSGHTLSADYLEKVGSIFSKAVEDYEDFVTAYLTDPALAPRPDRTEAREAVRVILRENRRMFDVDPVLAQPADSPAATRLSTVRLPTHIIVGSQDDGEIRNIANLLRSEIEGSEMTRLDGCGHLANLDEPELFNASVLEFIKRKSPG